MCGPFKLNVIHLDWASWGRIEERKKRKGRLGLLVGLTQKGNKGKEERENMRKKERRPMDLGYTMKRKKEK